MDGRGSSCERNSFLRAPVRCEKSRKRQSVSASELLNLAREGKVASHRSISSASRMEYLKCCTADPMPSEVKPPVLITIGRVEIGVAGGCASPPSLDPNPPHITAPTTTKEYNTRVLQLPLPPCLS